jgi:hypothetical protein
MVSCVLGAVTGELSHFDLRLEIPLKARVEDFALGRFQAVDETRNTSNVVSVGEVDHLFVDKILVAYSIAIRRVDRNVRVFVKLFQDPGSSVRRSFVIEHHVK